MKNILSTGNMRLALIEHLVGQYPKLLESAGMEKIFSDNSHLLLMNQVKLFEAGHDKEKYDFGIDFSIDRYPFLYSGVIDCRGTILHHNISRR